MSRFAVSDLVKRLAQDLKHGDSAVRLRSCLALGELGPSAAAALPHLMEVLRDDFYLAREAAVTALGRIGDVAAIPSLTRALHDRHWRVRERAAQVLGEYGPAAQAAIDSLHSALSDEDLSVRIAAARSIRRINCNTAIPTRNAVRRTKTFEAAMA